MARLLAGDDRFELGKVHVSPRVAISQPRLVDRTGASCEGVEVLTEGSAARILDRTFEHADLLEDPLILFRLPTLAVGLEAPALAKVENCATDLVRLEIFRQRACTQFVRIASKKVFEQLVIDRQKPAFSQLRLQAVTTGIPPRVVPPHASRSPPRLVERHLLRGPEIVQSRLEYPDAQGGMASTVGVGETYRLKRIRVGFEHRPTDGVRPEIKPEDVRFHLDDPPQKSPIGPNSSSILS